MIFYFWMAGFLISSYSLVLRQSNCRIFWIIMSPEHYFLHADRYFGRLILYRYDLVCPCMAKIVWIPWLKNWFSSEAENVPNESGHFKPIKCFFCFYLHIILSYSNCGILLSETVSPNQKYALCWVCLKIL